VTSSAQGIAIYLRVSTADQRTRSQRAEVERWLAGHGHDLADVQVYEDHESGATLARPGFEAFKAAVFAGEVSTLVVWRLDRLSRSLRDGINLLAELQDRGVRVVAVAQQLDLSGPVGKMLAAVLFGLAEIEREAIRERQAAGIRAARGRGVYQGRQLGATKGKPERARELRERGLGRTEIAQALGVSSRTVSRYLGRDN
jgi:DNA invertase Pin-like site-specific DNA recombinase